LGGGRCNRSRAFWRGHERRFRSDIEREPSRRRGGRAGREPARRIRPYLLDAKVRVGDGLCRRGQAHPRRQHGRGRQNHGMGREESRGRTARCGGPQGSGPDRQSRLCPLPARHEPGSRSPGSYPCRNRQSHTHAGGQMAGAARRQAVEPQHRHWRDLSRASARRAGAPRI
jgi:hypothetical protein